MFKYDCLKLAFTFRERLPPRSGKKLIKLTLFMVAKFWSRTLLPATFADIAACRFACFENQKLRLPTLAPGFQLYSVFNELLGLHPVFARVFQRTQPE